MASSPALSSPSHLINQSRHVPAHAHLSRLPTSSKRKTPATWLKSSAWWLFEAPSSVCDASQKCRCTFILFLVGVFLNVCVAGRPVN